ncbi:glucoamylase family protein [Streptomyces sp. MAR4 CNX-425]|uniref:glucoamylase family protein n=1 Tax=Streptomyces sp. MAR4 CNX-425 TaxID=3406343 RepID=UPI003B506E23
MERRTFLAATAATAGAATLGAGAGHAAARPAQAPEAVLTGWFEDTYRSLEAMVADNGLPADNIDLSGREPVLTENTSVTNIGCWIWSTVAAAGLGVIGEREMHARLARTVATVERMERLHGFWFNWYHTFTGEVLDEWPGSGAPVNHLLSTVDNGWLDVALRIAEDADPLLRGRIRRLRADIDWSFMYVPYDPADPAARPGHMSTGFRVADDALTPNFYGALMAETRISSYLGISDGTVPRQHYWHMLRTLEPGATQEMPPGGDWARRDGVTYFNGHYTHRGHSYIPNWNGTLFGPLMPELFVPSARWNRTWRTNITGHALVHREHGLYEAEYGYWGFSPCNIPEGGYSSYAVQYCGISPEGGHSNTDKTYFPYPQEPEADAYTNGVVTPHAAAMALMVTPRYAYDNLRRIARDFDAYEDGYGFYDSVNVGTGTVSDRMLSLDQGMTAAALAQVLQPGLLQRPFRTGGFRRRLKPLLAAEDFGI